MAKSKRSRTFLEVITQQGKSSGQGFPAPPWWKSFPAARVPEEVLADDPAAGSPGARPGRRVLQFGRWSVPLTPTAGVVALGGLTILAFAAWQIGRLPSRDRTESGLQTAGEAQTIEQLRQQPPRPDALRVLLGRADRPELALEATLASADLPPDKTRQLRADSRDVARPPARQPGLNYVVVETFRGPDALAEAQAARNFLKEKGIRASVEQVGDDSCLVTERGFEAGDPKLKDYCRKLEMLGQEYSTRGGKYRFKGCYGKLYRSDGW